MNASTYVLKMVPTEVLITDCFGLIELHPDLTGRENDISRNPAKASNIWVEQNHLIAINHCVPKQRSSPYEIKSTTKKEEAWYET